MKEAVFGECEEFYKRWSEFAKNGFSYQVSYSGFRVMGDSIQADDKGDTVKVSGDEKILDISTFKPKNDIDDEINRKYEDKNKNLEDKITCLQNLIDAISEEDTEEKKKSAADEKQLTTAFDVARKQLSNHKLKLDDPQLKNQAEELKKQLEKDKEGLKSEKETALNKWKKEVRSWGKFRILEVK